MEKREVEEVEEMDEIVMLAGQILNVPADKILQEKIQNWRGLGGYNKRVEIEIWHLKENLFSFVSTTHIWTNIRPGIK